MLKHILDERDDGDTWDDFINVTFDCKTTFEMFSKVDSNSDSVKLSLKYCENERVQRV